MEKLGIFRKWSDFKEGRRRKSIQRSIKTIKNSKALKEDRMGAIEVFKRESDPEIAIPGLLARFEYSLEHGINDTREKEACLAGIVKFKGAAIPYIQEHVNQTSRIAWPMKALAELGTEEQVKDVLISCLDISDIAFDQAKVDKNYDILCYLMDYKVTTGLDKVIHFLKDYDERVRFAAVEVLVEQGTEEATKYLEPFLYDETSENIRLHQTALDAFKKNNWVIQDKTAAAEHGLSLSESGTLK